MPKIRRDAVLFANKHDEPYFMFLTETVQVVTIFIK